MRTPDEWEDIKSEYASDENDYRLYFEMREKLEEKPLSDIIKIFENSGNTNLLIDILKDEIICNDLNYKDNYDILESDIDSLFDVFKKHNLMKYIKNILIDEIIRLNLV